VLDDHAAVRGREKAQVLQDGFVDRQRQVVANADQFLLGLERQPRVAGR
jgi:hypothetical protein